MKRLLAIVLVSLITLAASVQSAAAWAGPIEGRPSKLGPGSPTGFYLWGADSTLHLRSSSTSGANTFSGRITTDGKITYLHKVLTDSGDWATQVGPGEITFFFTTFQATDGFDFEVEGGSYVEFDLLLTGARINTDRIYTGSRNLHPSANPVVVQRD